MGTSQKKCALPQANTRSDARKGWITFVLALWLIGCPSAFGQVFAVFMLDDTPAAPAAPPVIPPFAPPVTNMGMGAEDPWGLLGAVPARGPSPTLGILALPNGDGDLLGYPFPVPLNVFVTGALPLFIAASPAYSYVSAYSHSAFDTGAPIDLAFSVDRASSGNWAPSGVATQAALNQASGDMFMAESLYAAPQNFIGQLNSSPFAGYLNARLPTGRRSNRLLFDEQTAGLIAGAPNIRPAVSAPPYGIGTHDNIDAFEMFPNNRGYFTVYPDVWHAIAQVLPGTSGGDIYDAATLGSFTCGYPPFARSSQMGLMRDDLIDALVVYDNGALGSAGCGGPGAQPGIDAVLFSLAPGSPSLFLGDVDSGDILFSDFTGAFAIYADASDLGLSDSGAVPDSGDNLDALDFLCPGDINYDGAVLLDDLTIYLGGLPPGDPRRDINHDGVIDAADTMMIINNLGCTS
jgi:hypothetical protein